MRDALARTIKDVQDAQAAVLTPDELKTSANSLNLCTSALATPLNRPRQRR